MRTRPTDLLQVEHPVMLAGLGGVSEAGGLGTLGAGAMSPDQMVEELGATKALTSKPFGVDLLTALPHQMLESVDLLIEEGVPVFVAALGVPLDVIERCHQHQVIVVNMCGKVRHALAAVEAGCDLVVAQGTEAGGHTGTVAT